MTFKLRSGNGPLKFKNMGATPVKQTEMEPIEASKTYEQVQKEIEEENLSPRKIRRKERRDLKKEYRKERKEEKDLWKDEMEGMSKEDKKTAKEVRRDERKAHKASYKKERKALKAKQKEEPEIDPVENMKKQKRTKEQRMIDARNAIAMIDSIIPSQFGGGRGVHAVQTKGQTRNQIENKKPFAGISDKGKKTKKGGNITKTENTKDSITTATEVQNLKTKEQKKLEGQKYVDMKSEKGDPYSYRKDSEGGGYQYKKSGEKWTEAEGDNLKAIQKRYGK